jgi:hypothetical protein
MWRKYVLPAVVLIGLLAPGAFAATVQVDFTDGSVFGPAMDQPSFTVDLGGFDLLIEARVFPVGDALLWRDDQDGFGVQFSYEQDEIEANELLQLSFSIPFILETVHISDLFNEFCYREIGYYEINGSGNWVEFMAAEDQLIGSTNGTLMLDINETIDFITFSAPGLLQSFQNHEFALAGFEGTPVPIPTPFVLLGGGLLGLLGLRKRMRS